MQLTRVEIHHAIETGMIETSWFWDENKSKLTIDALKLICYNSLGEYGKARYNAVECSHKKNYKAENEYMSLAKKFEWI